MRFEVTGLDSLGADLAAASVAAKPEMEAVLAKAGRAAYRDIRAGAPVRSGHLRDSVYIDVSGLDVAVGATADYAPIIEGGDSRQAPQPFIRPGVDKNLPGLYAGVEIMAGKLL